MTKNMIFVGSTLALLMSYSQNASAVDIMNMADQSTLRCPGGIVAKGDTDRAVAQKCGDPLEVQYLQDVGPVWIYHLGQSKFMHYMAFKFGKLERIVSAPCNNNDYDCYDLR